MNADPNVLDVRRSGILLHPTSLPGPNGCGDLGAPAHRFVDWLAAARQTLWQVLPLNPIGPGHSPYQSVSSFAGSPLLVALEPLVEQGWLPPEEAPGFGEARCDYARAIPWRMARLRRAWRGFLQDARGEPAREFEAFRTEHAGWLDDYAVFMALDQRHGCPWTKWPREYADRDPAALQRLLADEADEIGFWCFVQWQFMRQWHALRMHARSRGVHLVGDAPIFVAHHSADVWAHRAHYRLDEHGEPSVVAGVPPDYFSATGQRWGNPLYDWDAMRADGLSWWRARLAHLLSLVDVVRIDHFRGFESYWEVPAHEPHAINGRWLPGPGHGFFESMEAQLGLGRLPLIAEDLGMITEQVHALRRACALPGMRVLHFAFGDHAGNPYLPHNYERATVAYTGTHDNDTTLGWWRALDGGQRDAVQRYLGPQSDETIVPAMMRVLSQSVANTVIYPLQDVLGLDGGHRMNTPGLAQACWEWRFTERQLDGGMAERQAAMAAAHGRCP